MCDYAIEVTNGSKEANVVPIGVRQPLLQTWVLAKQMAQQQIPKTLGADDEVRDSNDRNVLICDYSLHWGSFDSFNMLKFLNFP